MSYYRQYFFANFIYMLAQNLVSAIYFQTIKYFLFYITVVLNDKQRVAKRKLIEDNRERRRSEALRNKLKHDECFHDHLTDDDRSLIDDIVSAYEQTSVNIRKPYTLVR